MPRSRSRRRATSAARSRRSARRRRGRSYVDERIAGRRVVDGRGRARPQPVGRRRRPHRGVRRDGRRHQRSRVAGAAIARARRDRLADLQLATYAGSPSPAPRAGIVADVALADHRRVGADQHRERRRGRSGRRGDPSCRARSCRGLVALAGDLREDLREDLGGLRARDAVLAVDDEERARRGCRTRCACALSACTSARYSPDSSARARHPRSRPTSAARSARSSTRPTWRPSMK